jgi:hypothetical protein
VSTTSAEQGAEPRSIDPRIRARRVEVIREQGRRRLRMLLGVACAGCAVGLGWLLVQSPFLDVDHVEATGAGPVTAAAVRAAARVEPGAALLTLDRGSIVHRVESIPWVERAVVTKHLPGTVDISVTLRKPAAWVARGPGVVALVDSSGRVLGDAAAAPAGIPQLDGIRRVPAPGGHVDTRLLRVGQRLPDELRAMVVGLALDHGGVTLQLAPDAPAGQIRLGSTAELTAKTDAALAVIHALDGDHVHYVDVTMPRTPATR